MVKKTLLSMAIAAAVVSLAGCNVSTTDKYDNKIINEGVQYGPASSVYPIFAPEAGQVPLAIDFLFADAGASDGTTNTADTCPAVTTAINKLDGFSTVAPLYIEFSADLDPATVQAGETVILVKLANAKDHSSIDALDLVTILEATNGVPFSPKGIAPTSYEANVISMNDGRTPAIQILLKEPLEPKTKYLVMLTNGIKGANGETIGQSTTYAHAIGSDEIVNPDLAPVRGALQGWQQLAQGFLASGTPLVANAKGKAVFNYAFTTGGTDDVLKAMAAPGTFLQGQVAAQITSIDIGEGAITAAVIGGGGNQAAADAQLDTIAGLVATQINAENPGTLPTTDGATIRPILKSTESLQPYYLAGLRMAITTSKGAPVIAAIDTPKSRDYNAIISAPNTAVPVSYDAFLTAQVTPKVEAQITSIAVGEGAITQAVIGGGGNQAAADAQLDTIAGLVATQINAENPGTLPTTDGATIRPILKSTESLQPYYLAGLRMAITTSKGAPVIAAIDTPKSRDYNAIISAPNTAVPVSYDAFLTAQVTPKVEAQIISIAVGEGAITQAVIGGGGNQAAADAQLDTIAGLVATQINAENPGTLPTTDGATIRPILKSTESLQPYYLTGLRTAITTSQVDALSSKGNIYQGGLSIPNYLPASEAGKADGELGTWIASADAATALGLDAAPTDVDGSTNVTYRFPFAKNLGMNTVPVMATLPDATACPKPADGYPVVIYQHGITVDRTAGVLVGNALATSPVCTAMVAIDHTMHGVAPGNATGLVFSTEKVASSVNLQDPSTYAASPFAAVRAGTLAQNPDNWMKDLHERHNNVGKNAAQANVEMKFASAGETADVGASGDLYINLNNFARTRDAMRQTVLDLMNLNASIGAMDIDGSGDLVVSPDGTITNPDLDPSKVYFIGHSLGAIIGTTFVAVNNDPDVQAFNGNLPKIQGAILGNGGGGVVKLLENSPSIGGAKILPGLQAAAGLDQGSADIEKFFGVMQAMVDSADPINFAGAEHMKTLPILSYEAVGGVGDAKPDLVVPNNALNATVATAKSYLAGTDPLVKLLGITTQYDQSTASALQQNPDGIRANVRVGTGDHSTFSNANPQDTFAEIYGQIGSFILSAGKAVNVDNTDVLEPAE